MKEKLLQKLPKKYRDRVQDFAAEDGLIDDCKYILTFADGYTWNGYETLPCKNIAEAITFVRETEKENIAINI